MSMDQVTLERDEWVAVARELDSAYQESAPAGLRARIAALLAETPATWLGEACTLELDAAAAEVVRRIVRRGRGLAEQPSMERSQAQAVEAAQQILRDDLVSGHNARYRVEHRSEGRAVMIAQTSAGDASQAELSELAARLVAAGATGEVVLVDVATGEVLARRYLRPDPDPDGGANGQSA
jgi:hypothetical protein